VSPITSPCRPTADIESRFERINATRLWSQSEHIEMQLLFHRKELESEVLGLDLYDSNKAHVRYPNKKKVVGGRRRKGIIAMQVELEMNTLDDKETYLWDHHCLHEIGKHLRENIEIKDFYNMYHHTKSEIESDDLSNINESQKSRQNSLQSMIADVEGFNFQSCHGIIRIDHEYRKRLKAMQVIQKKIDICKESLDKKLQSLVDAVGGDMEQDSDAKEISKLEEEMSMLTTNANDFATSVNETQFFVSMPPQNHVSGAAIHATQDSDRLLLRNQFIPSNLS
jgi:hypothetical protein